MLYRGGEDQFNSNSCIEINGVKLNSSNMEYAMILKILINGSFEDIATIFKSDIPSKYINFKEYFDEDTMEIDNDVNNELF